MSARLEITMKSGALVIVDVETWKLTKTASGPKSLEWKDGEGRNRRRLVTVDLDDVAAIVEVKR